jgi:adenosylcobinamide-phosphate guanylyltransferase
MKVLIMAGGKGSRLGGVKKPFLRICGRRLIDVVVEVAKDIAKDDKVYVCLPGEDTPYLSGLEDVNSIECPGKNYVEDLVYALERVGTPVLVLPADIPFLTADIVKEFLQKAQDLEGDVVTLMVCGKDGCRESGISLFRGLGGSWSNVYFDEVPQLRDVDTYEDLKWVEEVCGSTAVIGRLN